MKKLAVIIAAMCAGMLVMLTGIFPARADVMAAFSVDWKAQLELGQGEVRRIEFTPKVSSAYDLYVFPGGELRRAELIQGDRILARGAGDGVIFTAGLNAGQKYVLEVEGAGSAELELMRHSHGRSIIWPERIADGQGGGVILLPGNARWHAFTASHDNISIYVTPERPGPARLRAAVYTSGGALAARSAEMVGGGCRVYFEAEPGVDYRLRIWYEGEGTGGYRVRLVGSGSSAPDSLEIVTDDLTIREGDMRSVRARTWPLDADADMEWASSDPDVAEVSTEGVVTGMSPGTAQISVYAYGGLCATINVTVEAVQPEYIAYRGDFTSMRVGDVLTPSMQVYPAAAADDAGITYSSSAPEIVSVDENGEFTALSEGTAEITVGWGELSDSISVKVEEAPARYRALLISEQNYAAEVNTVRVGAVNTAYNLESLFSMADFDGEKCATTVEVDLTADEALEAIARSFEGAREKDISILYISCHGYYEDGMTLLQFVDGSELAACDLERALRQVPGTIVIIADCCDSGGLIGSGGSVSGGIITAFAGEPGAFSSSKYKVLASAALGQDSYRLGYASGGSDVVTVFAWALCDALGWDIDDQRRGPLNADSDYDGSITLWEAYLYTSRRVMWYLSRAGGGYLQDVQVYPQGDMFPLFERE